MPRWPSHEVVPCTSCMCIMSEGNNKLHHCCKFALYWNECASIIGHALSHTYIHAFGGYIYPISRGLRWSLQGLRWLHDGLRQSYVVLFSLMLSHDHRTMVAAYRMISRGRSQIVANYRTIVVRWSCNNRRLAYDLDSKMLRSWKTCRKAIVVCDCSYDCGKNHCDCPRSLSVVGSRRS